TISPYCVAPASPFVSGGRHWHPLPWAQGGPNGRQIPSKFASGVEIGSVPAVFWTTGSVTLVGAACGWRVSLSRGLTVPRAGRTTGSVETAGETPEKIPCLTCGP